MAFGVLAAALAWMQHAVLPAGHWWLIAGRGIVGLVTPALLAALLLYGVIIRRFGWTPRDVGWPAGSAAGTGAAVGLAWGVGLAGAALLLGLAGGARIAFRQAPDESYLAVAVPVAVGLGVAAALEELLFRGFPLARLARAMGRVGAGATLAAAFAVAHVGNPETSVLGLVNIGLAALLLSAVFFSHGGLAAAWGLHLGWNGGLALGADAPVSGLRFSLPALEYFPGRLDWITGGRFGPEGGLAATIVMVSALAWWTRRVWRRSAEGTA